MFSKKYTQIVSLVIIIATVYYSFSSLLPSEKIVESKTSTEFSVQKALNHLEKITQKPHFTGSEEHIVVLNYLVNELEKLGLTVEVQEQVAINKKWRAATNTKNIIAKIKGSENGKALLLLSHYDSNPHSSLGASDAGSGVVVILEGIRAFLAKKQQPKNDIIICITDAEELGLLGANAFVNHHPWAKDVGLVLNFEARGSGGPSYMLLETNGGNKNLIEAFQQANTPYPVANSLMYSIYKMLPNDTDLTVFREDGNIDGFNFAFICDHFDYHTAQDSFERMDLNTFQHQASYLTATLNYFANSDLENLTADEDFVFFNFPYLGLVFYPFSWIIPMLVICFVFFFTVLIIGFLKRKLTIKGILKGFIPLLLALIFSGLLAFYGWKLLLKIHPQYNNILHGFTYNGYWYIAGFTAFTLAICFWFYKGFFKKRSLQDLLIAPLFFWLLINVGVTFYLKGAAFFMLPVMILLSILSILIFSKNNKNLILLFTILSIPVIIIFTPFIKMFPVGLGLKMLVISAVFTVFLFGFLVPVFQQYKFKKKMIYVFIFIGGMCFISATTQASYSSERKQPNSIIYVLDANKNEAYWASYNTKVDEFTQQFLGENPNQGSYDNNITASKYRTGIKLHSKAPMKTLEKPIIQLVSDTIVGNDRIVDLQIISLRNANKIELLTKIPIQFKSLKVNGELLKSSNNTTFVLSVNNGTLLSYFRTAINDVLALEFMVDKNQKFDLEVFEVKFDLLTNPSFIVQKRADDMMPMPFVTNDATIVKTNIKF
jgi:hypothetical protein